MTKSYRLSYALGVSLVTVQPTVQPMPPTPVRNIRIDNDLWERLGKLATKRKTSITALLIEGAHLLLASSKAPKTTSVSEPALAIADVLKRLEALESSFEASVQSEVQQAVQEAIAALEERIAALELQVQLAVQLDVQRTEPEAETESEPLQPTVQDTVQSIETETEPNEVQETVQPNDTDEANLESFTQGRLAKRLGVSDKAVEKARNKGASYFANWSRGHDPDDIAWSWHGSGGRGHPMRYVALRG